MFNPGRNRTKIKIFDRVEFEETTLPTGEVIQKNKLKAVEWAEILTTTGRDFLENRKTETGITRRLRIRRRNDINVSDYVEINNQKMEIIFVSDPIQNYIELVVEWLTY